ISFRITCTCSSMAGSCVPAAKNWRWSWKRRATTGLSATNCSPPEQDMQTTTSIQAPKPTRDADPYLAAFERFENEAKHPSWLFPLRKAGLAQRKEPGRVFRRSEEHTAELQPRGHLVCRLLPVAFIEPRFRRREPGS